MQTLGFGVKGGFGTWTGDSFWYMLTVQHILYDLYTNINSEREKSLLKGMT